MFLLSLWLASTLACPAEAGDVISPGIFRAGGHEVEISPEKFPVIVNAMFTERSASRVVDRLYAKALVLDDGSNRVALCVVDSCMMPRELIDRVKALAAPAAVIPIDRMMISATHTHSAPAAMACLGSRADTNYAAMLPPRIAEAIVGAAQRLVPARIGWAVVEDWEHTFNRRWIRRPDRTLTDPFGVRNVRAHMHPGHESPDAIGPSGPVDPGLSVLAVETRAGQPLALLANYSQHYYESPLLSSDYYGRFAQHIARLLGATNLTPSFVGIMSQGTSGDLMWMDYGSPRRQIGYDAYGRAVAQRAFEAYRRIAWHDWAPLRMAEATLSLRYRLPDEQRLQWARTVVAKLDGRLPQTLPEIYAWEAMYLHARPETELKLQALRIGELGITAMPNEVFAITGLKLKLQSPLQPTFNIALANGAEGYIPPPEQHALGGYTTWPARTAGLEVSAEPRIVEKLLGLLEQLAAKPHRTLRDEHGPYPRMVLEAKPLAYWRLNEIAGPIARDAAGTGCDASFDNGTAFFLPGVGSGTGRLPRPELTQSSFSGSQVNRAAHFVGGRLRAHLPALPDTYTIEFWLWNGLPDEVRAVTGYLFSRGVEGDAARGDHLGITGTQRTNDSGRLFFFTGDAANQVLVGRAKVQLRRWHHVVLVREGNRATVFLDGQLDLRGELPSTVPRNATALFLGGRCDHFANFEGKLDEVAIYQRALTPDEITRHYHASGEAEKQARPIFE